MSAMSRDIIIGILLLIILLQFTFLLWSVKAYYTKRLKKEEDGDMASVQDALQKVYGLEKREDYEPYEARAILKKLKK